MPRIHVCSLARVAETVASTEASHLVSLVNDGTLVDRPQSIPADNHLFVAVSDVVAPTEGMTLPARTHVETLLAFGDRWDQSRPMVIHCFAGISRSTAAAFITMCRLNPETPELEIARSLRSVSRSAWPNPLLVAIADDLLGRDGRMIAAIEAIGEGAPVFEGEPFHLPVRDRGR